MEALIAAPVPRLSLLLAKFVAVITVATITASVNVTAMLATTTVSGLAPFLFGPGGITGVLVAQIFARMHVPEHLGMGIERMPRG